jgi:hypothetical protein
MKLSRELKQQLEEILVSQSVQDSIVTTFISKDERDLASSYSIVLLASLDKEQDVQSICTLLNVIFDALTDSNDGVEVLIPNIKSALKQLTILLKDSNECNDNVVDLLLQLKTHSTIILEGYDNEWFEYVLSFANKYKSANGKYLASLHRSMGECLLNIAENKQGHNPNIPVILNPKCISFLESALAQYQTIGSTIDTNDSMQRTQLCLAIALKQKVKGMLLSCKRLTKKEYNEIYELCHRAAVLLNEIEPLLLTQAGADKIQQNPEQLPEATEIKNVGRYAVLLHNRAEINWLQNPACFSQFVQRCCAHAIRLLIASKDCPEKSLVRYAVANNTYGNILVGFAALSCLKVNDTATLKRIAEHPAARITQMYVDLLADHTKPQNIDITTHKNKINAYINVAVQCYKHSYSLKNNFKEYAWNFNSEVVEAVKMLNIIAGQQLPEILGDTASEVQKYLDDSGLDSDAAASNIVGANAATMTPAFNRAKALQCLRTTAAVVASLAVSSAAIVALDEYVEKYYP